jgi:tRNA(Ile)-lysidine synthase
MDLAESVRRVIHDEELVDLGDRVLVGLSGGVDSSTLFFVLDSLKNVLSLDLAIAHVNHQLRGAESERDEAFVRGLARKAGVPYHLLCEDVKAHARKAGVSIQHAGRDVRYAFFSRLAAEHGYQKIAIAHNRDDQVETFLLRVVKGTGINGLSSIPIRRGLIIRPFLHSYRSEIEAYAVHHSVPYVEDSSNFKDAYERNFVRHRITPLLEKLNPKFREKMLLLLADITSLNAGLASDAEYFLRKHAQVDSRGGVASVGSIEGEAPPALLVEGATRAPLEEGGEIRIPVQALKTLDPEVRFRVVSRLLSRLEPTFVALRQHIGLVEKSVFSRRPNNSITLPHGIKVKRIYENVVFTKKPQAPSRSVTFDIQAGRNSLPSLGLTLEVSLTGDRPCPFPADKRTAFLDADIVGPLALRTFREGDRFVPLGMTQSVKLKDYFISRKIPREQRRMIPLLVSGKDIVWVVGERIDERYKLTAGTARFMRITVRPMAPAEKTKQV